MSKFSKKILSVLLTLCIMAWIFPLNISALNTDAQKFYEYKATGIDHDILNIGINDANRMPVKAGCMTMAEAEKPGTAGVWDGSAADSFAGGSGTADDPYLITNGAELAYLAQLTNSSSIGNDVYFKMTADIYLNDTEDWENWSSNPPANTWNSIGYFDDDSYTAYPFMGHFDGADHTVYGIYINNADSWYTGLFGANIGIIKNLNVESSYINVHSVAAGVVGCNTSFMNMRGRIENCTNHGTVLSGHGSIGGIAGENMLNASVINCCNFGLIKSDLVDMDNMDFSENVGGVVGNNYSDGYVYGCLNLGNVNGTSYTGGVVGFNSAEMASCHNAGTVEGLLTGTGGAAGTCGMDSITVSCSNSGAVSGNASTGGISGYSYSPKAFNSCSNTGSVTGDTRTGGVLGETFGVLDQIVACSNSGDVSANEEAGGIVGYNISNGFIVNCYNTGNISGNSCIGGINGHNEVYLYEDPESGEITFTHGNVLFSYSIGNVTGETNVGPIVGLNDTASDSNGDIYQGIIVNCYYLDTCYDGEDEFSAPLTDAQMQDPANFLGYDFMRTWTMEGNPNYPYPELDEKRDVTFVDSMFGGEQLGTVTVHPGVILSEADFPEPPVHEGFEFKGWQYDGRAIVFNTAISAVYEDPDAIGFYFESDPAEEGWTFDDADGDGVNWRWLKSEEDPNFVIPEGCCCMNSESYLNEEGPIFPDNWLISPAVPGGGCMVFKMVAQDKACPGDFVGVYVSTDGGTNWSDEIANFTAGPEIQTYIVDLSQYENQKIKIAFRHYNSTDFFSVNIDAVQISVPDSYVEPVIPGDCNGDGEITVADAIMILRYAMDLEDNIDFDAADYDKDGEITTTDAVLVLRAAVIH